MGGVEGVFEVQRPGSPATQSLSFLMPDETTHSDRDPLGFLGAGDGPQRESALRRVFHQIAADASEAIVVTEPELAPPGPRILWVNRAFTDITGYERTDVLGETPRLLQGPDTEAAVLDRLRRRLSNEERFEGETVNYRKDGTPYVNHWSVAPVRGPDGALVYWVSIQRDVTEKRQLEEEVVRTLDEERRRIGRALHDSVGSLVTAASMRLENLAHREATDAPLRDQLTDIRETIRDSYDRLRRISQGLSPVDLSDGQLSLALQRLASNTPQCEVHWDVDLDAVLADLDLHALENLYWIVYEAVTNAERHADPDTIEIWAACDDDSSESRLRLGVTDDGDGFDVGAASEEAWGLRLMKYRADLIGGTVQVESEPGAGTRVACHLYP
jgi:PAS domain S-box-containing protein